MQFEIDRQGWLVGVRQARSPNCDPRPDDEISLLVLHNISLPAGEFGNHYIEQLFLNCLDCQCHLCRSGWSARVGTFACSPWW